MIINAAKATKAAGILGVELSTLNPDLLSAAYRSKSKEHHPDVAGASYDQQKWADVSWAKEVLVRWLERPLADPVEATPSGDCRACGGVGRIPMAKTKGFGKPATMMCVMCNGSGTLSPEPHKASMSGE